MAKLHRPNERPDAAPPHPNLIRRFREELRLTRNQFADLLQEKVDTLRVWEGDTGAKPRGEKAIKISDLAKKNAYPLSVKDIFNGAKEPASAPKKRLAKKKR
jgi:DNA-binding XRE family transcriptional regulator